MSHKLDLSHLDRSGGTSITQQLVDRFVAAIERGELAPDKKLPPTRKLAAEAHINHLTAARVYRRLAELGYVSATVGRGTFVRALAPAAGADGDDWQTYALPPRDVAYAEQVLAEALSLSGDESVISLATGGPAPDLSPTADLARIAADVFAEEGSAAISLLTAEGLYGLREQIALRGRDQGFAFDTDEVIVTSGAQQAIDLTARSVLQPGDVAAVESPTYLGLLSSLRATGARVLGIPVDAHGLDVDMLEALLGRHEIKLVALQTASHNPTGCHLSEERRTRLAELAVERNLFVLEDRVYADVRFEGTQVRPLRELAPGHVIHINSLSKVVGGGIRIGWLACRGPLRERIAMLKLQSDLHTSTLAQHLAARFLASGGYDRHLQHTIPTYRERRDGLMAALERHLPGEYRAEVPRGGHHVWVTLARPIDERALYAEGMRTGVTFVPGGAVTAERRSHTSLRLSFSLRSLDELDEGMRRLARAVREARRRARRSVAAPVG